MSFDLRLFEGKRAIVRLLLCLIFTSGFRAIAHGWTPVVPIPEGQGTKKRLTRGCFIPITVILTLVIGIVWYRGKMAKRKLHRQHKKLLNVFTFRS